MTTPFCFANLTTLEIDWYALYQAFEHYFPQSMAVLVTSMPKLERLRTVLNNNPNELFRTEFGQAMGKILRSFSLVLSMYNPANPANQNPLNRTGILNRMINLEVRVILFYPHENLTKSLTCTTIANILNVLRADITSVFNTAQLDLRTTYALVPHEIRQNNHKMVFSLHKHDIYIIRMYYYLE